MTDYSPLHGGDAFPADPDAVKAYGSEVSATGALIADSVRLLRRCADEDNWETETADAFREKARDLADDIDKARKRYETVGDTLVKVAGKLEEHERKGGNYAIRARELEATAGRAEHQPGKDPDGAEVPLTSGQTQSNTARQNAIDELKDLQKDFNDEVGWARDAADSAARTIKGALDDDVKDSWWDRNAGWLRTVTTVLSVIIAIAAIVLLTVATGGTIWIVAMAVSVAAGLISLTINIGLAKSGNGSWWNVAFDVVALLTLGAGGLATKAFGKAFPALRAGMGEMRGMQAFTNTFKGFRLGVGELLSKAPFQFLSKAGGKMVFNAADRSFGAMRTARAAAEAAPNVSKLRAFVEGGRQTASDFKHARTMLTELRTLSQGAGQFAPQAEALLQGAKSVPRAINLVRGSQLVNAVRGVGQLGYNAHGGSVDPGNAAQVVIDLIGRVR